MNIPTQANPGLEWATCLPKRPGEVRWPSFRVVTSQREISRPRAGTGMSQIPALVEYPPHDRGAKTVAEPSCTTEQKLLVLFQSLYHNRIIRSFVHVRQYHFGAGCTSSATISRNDQRPSRTLKGCGKTRTVSKTRPSGAKAQAHFQRLSGTSGTRALPKTRTSETRAVPKLSATGEHGPKPAQAGVSPRYFGGANKCPGLG